MAVDSFPTFSEKGWERTIRSHELDRELHLVKVYSTEQEELISYVEALYQHDDQVDSLIHIREGVKSLLRNEALATPFFIREGNKKIGYVILTRYHSVKKGGLTIFIDELFVEPEFRRKGVGKQILQEIYEIAIAEKARTLWATTEPFNEAAQKFFTSQGFRPDASKGFERPV
ncbi:MAG: GNAT family N-acetyltransferase [Bdellovibrionota bacterium]